MEIKLSDKDFENLIHSLRKGENKVLFTNEDGTFSERLILQKESSKGRPVRCVELDRIFPSIREAAQFCECTPANVRQAIRLKCACKGFHFHYFYGVNHSRKFTEYLREKEDE
jgi:hypothetical protein